MKHSRSSVVIFVAFMFLASSCGEVKPGPQSTQSPPCDPAYLLLWDDAVEVQRGTHFITTNLLLVGCSAGIAAIQDSELEALRNEAIDLIGDNTIRLMVAFDDRAFRQREIVGRLNSVLPSAPFSDVYLLDFSFGEALWGPNGDKNEGDDA